MHDRSGIIDSRLGSFLHSVTSLTNSHSAFKFSFHSDTLLSPPDTARILPEGDQLTLHSTESKGKTLLNCQDAGSAGLVLVQILTVLSWLADAM